jgi:hypothetical protein
MAEPLLRTHPLMVSLSHSTTKCRECAIFIGAGHVDRVPLPSPDGLGYLCHACWQSVRRRGRSTTYTLTRWVLV